MSDHLLIPSELVLRIRQHLAELRELNADLTWTDVSEVAELDALKPAQLLDLKGVAKYRPEIDPLDGLSMTMDNIYGEWLEVYDVADKLLPPAIGYSRESLREALLNGSMPMIASKMSKSGESEAVEYVPLESVLDAILRLIGSTEKKIIK